MAKKTRFKQGKFEPKNKEKYLGDVNNIRYLSSWELVLCQYFDNNPSVLKWSSESIVVPYYSHIDEKNRRYMVDFYVEYKNKDGDLIKELIECKPYLETQPPVRKQGKKKSTYLRECYTYNVNIAKWAAATKYAKDRKWIFRLITEKQLFNS